MYQETIPWTVNYDEAQIPPYTLPDVLTCQDGTKVTTPQQWTKRRAELLNLFYNEMYGRQLPMPDHVDYQILSEKKDALNGKAVRREIRIHLSMDSGRSHDIDMICYVPAKATAKVPVFVGLTFGGNHVISNEEDIRMTGLAYESFGDFMKDRGCQIRRFPLEHIMDRGYAFATASYHDIFPDHIDGWTKSVFDLWFTEDELKARPKGYSSIGAWAWGISRMLDCLQTVPGIDGTKAAVYGHSRLGKTALWTGVTDTRFGLTCVNDSGCGGAALSRRLYGETLYSMYFQNNIGEWWFTETLKPKAKTPEILPLDQHELIALVAPRAVAVHSATEDQWADPHSEYLSAYHAGPVYRLLGKTPLASINPPPPETPVGTDVSYFLRTGKHDLLLSDWDHYMDMADRIFK